MLDVAPPPLTRRGAAAARAAGPRRVGRSARPGRASCAVAGSSGPATLVGWGCRRRRAPVAGDWLADPAHWRRLRRAAGRGGGPATPRRTRWSRACRWRRCGSASACPTGRWSRRWSGRRCGAAPVGSAPAGPRAARAGGPGGATGPRRVRRPAVPRAGGRTGSPTLGLGPREIGAAVRAGALLRLADERGAAARRARRRGAGAGRVAAAVHPQRRPGRPWTPPAGWRCRCWSCWTGGA